MNESINSYLNSGGQTKISEDFKKEIPKIPQNAKIKDIFILLNFLHEKVKFNNNNKYDYFRKRTAEEIFKSGFATGCTDYALVFLCFTRANNIPARYVEAIRNKWLNEGGDLENIEGHIFVEIYFEDQWLITDPENSSISNTYSRHKILERGLDSWDIGIKDLETLKTKLQEFKKTFQS